eukprot:TRINITY_DN8395_c0_g1_i1.p1 TRINITY_DN8395_c0_g1~~TRINITY_DN8395_c0_g1_i1.p1  ORF type:complete len:288 (+),score=31.79 TRINITY_DN8395_c0_g1_i1:163-1026(+)
MRTGRGSAAASAAGRGGGRGRGCGGGRGKPGCAARPPAPARSRGDVGAGDPYARWDMPLRHALHAQDSVDRAAADGEPLPAKRTSAVAKTVEDAVRDADAAVPRSAYVSGRSVVQPPIAWPSTTKPGRLVEKPEADGHDQAAAAAAAAAPGGENHRRPARPDTRAYSFGKDARRDAQWPAAHVMLHEDSESVRAVVTKREEKVEMCTAASAALAKFATHDESQLLAGRAGEHSKSTPEIHSMRRPAGHGPSFSFARGPTHRQVKDPYLPGAAKAQGRDVFRSLGWTQ